MSKLPAFGLGLALLLWSFPAEASTPRFQEEVMKKTGLQDRLGERLPLDLVFQDEAANPVELGRFFGQKPVLLIPVYHRCPMLCSLALKGLGKALSVMTLKPGRDFELLVVSIDPRDTAESAQKKKAESASRLGAVSTGRFLTSPDKAAAIETLTAALGFQYAYDPESGDYAHPAVVFILAPDGKISRYLTGIDYSSRELAFALTEASRGKTGSVLTQALLLCYHYDPATGRYGLAVTRLLRAGGLLTVALLAGFILLSLRREKAGSR